jgi:predicted membrane channel-forming protein YqfA (hemolysin III family)
VALGINEIEGKLEIYSRLDYSNIVSLIGAAFTPRCKICSLGAIGWWDMEYEARIVIGGTGLGLKRRYPTWMR